MAAAGRDTPPTDPSPGLRTRVRWALRVAVVLMGVWLLLSGLQAWWLGLGLAALGGVVGATLAPGDAYPWRPLRLAGFVAWFLHASLLGGVDVARRVFRTRVDVSPCFGHWCTGLPPGQPRTLLASLLSLLPGTLTADIDGDRGVLLVHGLAPSALDSVPVLEARVAGLFGIDAGKGHWEDRS